MYKIIIRLLITQLLIFLFSLIVSCSKSQSLTIIEGDIPNLPDGTLYLYEGDGTNRIDSVKTNKGIFKLSHRWNKKEPLYIGIDHVDKKGVLRFFSFMTNAKYRGAGWGTSVFLSDPIIKINGNLKYDTLVGIQLSPDRKAVTGPPLTAGKQTDAYYDIDGDLFENITAKTIQIITAKVAQYPYSYHLLYKINENKNSFSAEQIQAFLKSFQGEITQSETYNKLYAYNKKRFNEAAISLPLLEDTKGIKKEIIDRKYKKHLIVFWASWCGPCRAEIPLLKKVYTNSDKDTEFISISIDENSSAWQKALTQENMIWKQLIVNNKNKDYEKLQIRLKLNGAIPYTILVDNNIKILKSFTGLSSEAELLKILNVK